MSEGKNYPRLVDLISDLDTLIDVNTQWLFAEYVKAASGTLDCDFGVHPVLNADDNSHCNPWLALADEDVGCGE